MLEKHTTTGAADRAILVGLYTTDSRLSPDRRLGELSSLVTAANGAVVGRVVQRRGLSRGEDIDRPMDAATYIGKGKVGDVQFEITANDANLVVFDNELSPAQIRELEKRLQCRVIDRSELILDIFAARARTRAAMLQVELAQLQYTAPRLRGMWSHLERQAGGGGAPARPHARADGGPGGPVRRPGRDRRSPGLAALGSALGPGDRGRGPRPVRRRLGLAPRRAPLIRRTALSAESSRAKSSPTKS